MKIKILLPVILLISSAHVDACCWGASGPDEIQQTFRQLHDLPSKPNIVLSSPLYSLTMKDLYELAKRKGKFTLQPNIDIVDKYGLTLLHYAAWRGEEEVVDHLLSLGAKPNVMCQYGPPLHVALTWGGNPNIALKLLSGGANPDVGEFNALAKATEYGWDTVVDWLLAHCTEIPSGLSSSFIHGLVGAGDIVTLKTYFKYADKFPQLKSKLLAANASGETPLMTLSGNFKYLGMRGGYQGEGFDGSLLRYVNTYCVDFSIINVKVGGADPVPVIINKHNRNYFKETFRFLLENGARLTDAFTIDYFDAVTRKPLSFHVTVLEKFLNYYQEKLNEYRILENSDKLSDMTMIPDDVSVGRVTWSHTKKTSPMIGEVIIRPEEEARKEERDQRRKQRLAEIERARKAFLGYLNHNWGFIGALLARDYAEELTRINWSAEPTSDTSYPAELHRIIWKSKVKRNVIPRILDGIANPHKYLTAEIDASTSGCAAGVAVGISSSTVASVDLADVITEVIDLDPPMKVVGEAKSKILQDFYVRNTGLNFDAVKILYSMNDGMNPSTQLSSAVDFGDEEAVKILLLSNEFSIDELSFALLFAAKNGHLRIAQLLHDLGADINSKKRMDIQRPGVTALDVAAKENHAEMCRWLLSKGADPMSEKCVYPSLTYAIAAKSTDAVMALLEAGVPISGRFFNSLGQNYDYAKRIWSDTLRLGNLEIVQLLIKHGFNPNDFEYKIFSFDLYLNEEEVYNKRCIIKYLAQNVDDFAQKVHKAMQKVDSHIEVSNVEKKIATFIEDPSQNVDEKDSVKYPAQSFYKYSIQFSSKILREGFDPNDQLAQRDRLGDDRLFTALASAAHNDHAFEIMRMLLERGANPNIIINMKERTVLHSVAQRGNPKLYALLIKYGADPEMKDSDGRTPLELVDDAYLECFKAQIERLNVLQRIANASSGGGVSEFKGGE